VEQQVPLPFSQELATGPNLNHLAPFTV